MSAWYNELDPFAAAWLRQLIKAGLIAEGIVDERSIVDVSATDLVGFKQCHFFAGIGVWSHALRQAGWSDDAPVWTGSCPCQPLSSAGQRRGHVDERHLWPAFHRLIAECRPTIVLGEQVAGKDGREWFAAVRADLEASGYACGAADLPAAGVGAPHIRQRLWFVAQAPGEGLEGGGSCRGARPGHQGAAAERGGEDGRLAHANASGRADCGSEPEHNFARSSCPPSGLADADPQRVRDCGRGADPATAGGERGEAQQRQRLWPDARPDGEDGADRLADADGGDAGAERQQRGGQQRQQPQDGGSGGLADAESNRRAARHSDDGGGGTRGSAEGLEQQFDADSSRGRLADAVRPGSLPGPLGGVHRSEESTGSRHGQPERLCDAAAGTPATGPADGFWRNADWLLCRDGKWRPVESGTFPLAHGAAARVGRLRGYGNAINAEAARTFIEAVMA